MNVKLSTIWFFSPIVCVRAADDDSDQSERHIQRGAAHGGGWALVGLPSAGILQPGNISYC